MAVLFARLREIALPILREGGDSNARGTRFPAAGPVAWTHSGRRVRLIHNPGSENRRLHAERGGADADSTGQRALRVVMPDVSFDHATRLARKYAEVLRATLYRVGDPRTSGRQDAGGTRR